MSIFSDSRPDSDISFRDAAEGLLRQSAERYVVGVDNLTVSMDGFSMIDQTLEPEVLLEVLLLQHRAVNADLLGNRRLSSISQQTSGTRIHEAASSGMIPQTLPRMPTSSSA